VRQVFMIESESKVIAGSYMRKGKAYNDSIAAIFRESREIYKGRLSSLKRFKETVKEVKEGYECGIIIEGFKDIKEGDSIIIYEEVQKVKKI